MKRLLLLLFLLIVNLEVLQASFVRNQPCQVRQPDGSTINCYQSGDEYYNWLHDISGFTIIQAPDGYYYYGIRENDLVAPSGFMVNSVDPEAVGLKKWAKISKTAYLKRKHASDDRTKDNVQTPHTGTLNNLVIYIRFSDDSEFTSPRQLFDDLFNLPDGNSMKSYYTEVSYSQFTVSSTHYPACAMTTNISYQDSHSRNYYMPYHPVTNPGGYNGDAMKILREHTLIRDAISWININSPVPPTLNIDNDGDNRVDNISFIVRGTNGAWSNILWAHHWTLFSFNSYINGKLVNDYTFQPESQANVTTICHELFHSLNAPDLYHYDDGPLNISPVYDWDIMDSGSGHMSAYMKWRYTGHTWISSIPEIITPGVYSLQPLTSASNNCYRIASPYSSSEYFIVEYRRATGNFESNLPGSGLIVYRINPALTGNDDGPPDEVYVYRPNGTSVTNGYPWNAFFSQQSERISINDTTNPASFLENGGPGGLSIYNVGAAGNTITFSVSFNAVSNPYNFVANANSQNLIDLTWHKNGANSNVLLVSSISPITGEPQNGTCYHPGTPFPGGGYSLYYGNNNSMVHSSIEPGSTHFYKLWSVDGMYNYSTGITAQETSACTPHITPYSEDFSGDTIPNCWIEQYYILGQYFWSHENSTFAGGETGEMRARNFPTGEGELMLFLPPVNTIGVSQLGINFRHFIDAVGPGVTFRVKSSTNGFTWFPETWSISSSASNVGPEIVNAPVTHNLNIPWTYLAFTVQGDLSEFDNWYIDDVSVTFNSVQTCTITTYASPVNGGVITGGGIFMPGTSIELQASPAAGYNFLNWTWNDSIVSTEPAYAFSANSNRVLVANFAAQQYNINLTADPPGFGITNGSGMYDSGSQITVSASPETGYSFLNWTDNGTVVSTLAVYSFTTESNRNLIANFGIQQCTITTFPNPPEGGSTQGDGIYAYGDMVTISAVTSPEWYFVHWTENNEVVSSSPFYQFIAIGNQVLTAVFTQNPELFTINVNCNPPSGGTVTGTGTYVMGYPVFLNAIPGNGWEFISWTENGSLVSMEPEYSFITTADRTLTANFGQQFTILGTPYPDYAGYTSGSGLFTEGETATLEAVAVSGYEFINWTLNGNSVSVNPVYSFTVIGNREYIAHFHVPVGMDEKHKEKIIVYPNPTDGVIIVKSEIPGSVMISTVSISDFTGRELWNFQSLSPVGEVIINLSGFPAGVMILRVETTENTPAFMKIILNH